MENNEQKKPNGDIQLILGLIGLGIGIYVLCTM